MPAIFRRIQSNLLLTHYDPKLPTIDAADASTPAQEPAWLFCYNVPNGSWKAMQHASRILNPVETSYGQPETDEL